MPRKKKQRYGDYCEIINGVMYGSIQIPIGGGKYKRKRRRVINRTEARQWALEQLDRIKHGAVSDDDLKTLPDLIEWYKNYFLNPPVFERGLKVEGVKDWKKSQAKLDRIAAFFGPKRLASFNETDLLSYARHRREKDRVTTATINRDLSLMRAMFKKAHEASPSIKVPKFPINTAAENERDRVMSFDEERAILAACDALETLEYTRKGRKVKAIHQTNREHLKAIIILAVDTAMRSGEIFSLEWPDIDFDHGIITIQSRNSKTQKTRKVGLTPRVRDELLKLKSDKGKVFGIASARKGFATACRRAKVYDLHFHDLRHTATTRMIRAGIPHMEVMKITGHSVLKTFLRYLNLKNDTILNASDVLGKFTAQN